MFQGNGTFALHDCNISVTGANLYLTNAHACTDLLHLVLSLIENCQDVRRTVTTRGELYMSAADDHFSTFWETLQTADWCKPAALKSAQQSARYRNWWLLALLASRVQRWENAKLIVQLATLLGWHRRVFRLHCQIFSFLRV
jgi:hypothetical protein